jgi:hypothetical protein
MGYHYPRGLTRQLTLTIDLPTARCEFWPRGLNEGNISCRTVALSLYLFNRPSLLEIRTSEQSRR